MTTASRARRTMAWLVLAFGVAVVIVSLVDGFTSDPQSGEGWGGGVIAAVFAGGPLLAIGAGLRSRDQRVARWTVAGAAVAAVVVAFVLVMQVLDENETATNRALTSVGLAVYVVAAVVDLPLARHRR